MIKEMVINGDPNTSSSLQIVEPENRITFTSSIHSSFDISHDDLHFSKDQQSISFHIEDDRKEPPKEPMFAYSILSNDPPKRNRKEIFSKYKINLPNHQPHQHNSNLCADNEIMRAFDEIFSLGTPKSLSNGEIPLTKNQQSKTYVQPGPVKNSQISRPIRSINKLAEIQSKTPQKNGREPTRETQKTESPAIGTSSEFFRTPLELSQEKPKQEYNKANMTNISDIEYRISVIDNRQADISKDSSDFADLLNAQIFYSNLKSPRNSGDKLIPTSDSVQSQLPSPFQKQSTVPPANRNSKITIAQKQTQQNMQLSRFSDVYQRIDMSQSIANSILVRNPRMQIFNQPGTNSHGNFMGSTESIGSKAFSKSNSFGNLMNQQEQTLINGLGSLKMIQEASQENIIPIYLRKAAKANSIFPNFAHPATKINTENENLKLQELVQSFSEALRFLEMMLQKIRVKQQKRREIIASFSNGITLQKFKTCNWEGCMHFEHLERLKPRQNLLARQWNDMKVQKALGNYRKIVQHHRGIILNLNDERGIAKYFQIRKKYWDIQKNLIFITEDMFTRSLCLGFPKHFLQFKRILQQEQILFTSSQMRKKKTQLQHFRLLRNKNDQLCASEVGSLVIKKLINEIKFSSTAY